MRSETHLSTEHEVIPDNSDTLSRSRGQVSLRFLGKFRLSDQPQPNRSNVTLRSRLQVLVIRDTWRIEEIPGVPNELSREVWHNFPHFPTDFQRLSSTTQRYLFKAGLADPGVMEQFLGDPNVDIVDVAQDPQDARLLTELLPHE